MATQILDGKATDRPRNAPVGKRRRVWSGNPVVVLWGTVVGKKVVMAVTGLVLVGFVIAHMLGNLKIFLGGKPSTPTRCSSARWESRRFPPARSSGPHAASCSPASRCTSPPPSSSPV